MEQLIKDYEAPVNNMGEPIVIGCNYHATWQKSSKMRFVLANVRDGKANLVTRRTKSNLWTDINDLIFIKSGYNIRKAKQLLK